MKTHKNMLVLLLSLFVVICNAQQWQPVGFGMTILAAERFPIAESVERPRRAIGDVLCHVGMEEIVVVRRNKVAEAARV